MYDDTAAAVQQVPCTPDVFCSPSAAALQMPTTPKLILPMWDVHLAPYCSSELKFIASADLFRDRTVYTFNCVSFDFLSYTGSAADSLQESSFTALAKKVY